MKSLIRLLKEWCVGWLSRLDQRARWGVCLLIELYQLTLSPWLGRSCRFSPTCSHYGLEAFRTHHFFTALRLTCWRLLRCQPFAQWGFDPVPERKRP